MYMDDKLRRELKNLKKDELVAILIELYEHGNNGWYIRNEVSKVQKKRDEYGVFQLEEIGNKLNDLETQYIKIIRENGGNLTTIPMAKLKKAKELLDEMDELHREEDKLLKKLGMR